MAYIQTDIRTRATGSKFSDIAFEATAKRERKGGIETMSRYGATPEAAEKQLRQARWTDGTPVELDENGIITDTGATIGSAFIATLLVIGVVYLFGAAWLGDAGFGTDDSSLSNPVEVSRR